MCNYGTMNVRSHYLRINTISIFLGPDHTGHCLCDKCTGQVPSLTGKMLFQNRPQFLFAHLQLHRACWKGPVMVDGHAMFFNSLQSSAYDNVYVISKTVCYKYHEVVLLFSFSERHEWHCCWSAAIPIITGEQPQEPDRAGAKEAFGKHIRTPSKRSNGCVWQFCWPIH